MLIKEVVNCKTGQSIEAESVIEEANKNGNYRTNLRTKKKKDDIELYLKRTRQVVSSRDARVILFFVEFIPIKCIKKIIEIAIG